MGVLTFKTLSLVPMYSSPDSSRIPNKCHGSHLGSSLFTPSDSGLRYSTFSPNSGASLLKHFPFTRSQADLPSSPRWPMLRVIAECRTNHGKTTEVSSIFLPIRASNANLKVRD